MKTVKRMAALLLAGAMTLPVFSCTHGGTSKEDEFDSQVQVDNNGVNVGLMFNEDPKDDSDNPYIGTEPIVTTVRGEDGSYYVNRTDINGTTVTEDGGKAVTELYTGTTLATSYADSSYEPAFKSHLAMWLDTTKKSDFVFDGELLVYEIKINDDAKDGVYPVQLYHTDFANYDGVTLPVIANVGYICVNADAPDRELASGSDLTLTPNIVSGKPGDTVQLVISMTNNPGITGFVLKMTYDSKAITILNAKAGEDFGSRANLTQNNIDDSSDAQ